MDYIGELREKIDVVRNEVVHHPLYAKIKDVDDVKVFMEHHIFAVWDFMSLLKALQRELTCVSVPWFPRANNDTVFLINEIVTGEESDEDEDGKRMSHFELYLAAMKQSGASTNTIEAFIHHLKDGLTLDQAIEKVKLPDTVAAFIRFTFDVIHSGKLHVIAAVFTFGREDLIPNMFISMIKDMHQSSPEQMSKFVYYLERHIEVDGGHHGHLALAMTKELCGSDAQKWQEAEEACLKSLQMRKLLWDGVLQNLA
jgi:hypothetical protein